MLNKSLTHLYTTNRLTATALLLTLVAVIEGCQFNRAYEAAETRAKEDALQTALKYTRQAITDYTRDHGEPPGQLDDLVQTGYFNSLPIDPMTNKSDWSIEFLPCHSHGPCKKLIKDVHSSSNARSSRNNLYSEW